jgi:hypothetical protein
LSSAAFLIAAVGIVATHRRGSRQDAMPVQGRQTVIFTLLVSSIGVGSFIQHGPDPDWQAYAHDLPLSAVLIFLAADAVSDLTERELSPAWWLVPTGAMVPAVAAGSTASTAAQAAMATVAISVNLVRAWRRPAVRKGIVWALISAAAGAAFSSLADRSVLCQPGSLFQGHAIWHVLAAAALWRLGALIGVRAPRKADHASFGVPAPPKLA